MSEPRFVTSDRAACPSCGCSSAVVRVNGNAFAATCVECGHAEIMPMLLGQELIDCFDEHEPVAPVSIMRASSTAAQLPERELLRPSLAVRFEL